MFVSCCHQFSIFASTHSNQTWSIISLGPVLSGLPVTSWQKIHIACDTVDPFLYSCGFCNTTLSMFSSQVTSVPFAPLLSCKMLAGTRALSPTPLSSLFISKSQFLVSLISLSLLCFSNSLMSALIFIMSFLLFFFILLLC